MLKHPLYATGYWYMPKEYVSTHYYEKNGEWKILRVKKFVCENICVWKFIHEKDFECDI
jgi:hypothetical protein